MDGLAHTSRGVLGSALLLLMIGGGMVWSLNEAHPVTSRRGPSFSPPLVKSGREAIRVALSRRPVSAVRLRIDGQYRIVSLDDPARSIVVPHPMPLSSVTANREGLQIAGKTWSGSGVQVEPESSPGIWVEGRKYRGAVQLLRHGSEVRAINFVPLEEYVAAVVDAEMPAAFPVAARQAQAIAARTYAVSCQRRPAAEAFDLYATPISQNYLGVVYEDSSGRLLAGETAEGRAAAAATANIVCTYDGTPFRAYYSACCGGQTFPGATLFDDAGPLPAVSCDGCDAAPLFRWHRQFSDAAALRRLAEMARVRLPAFRQISSAKTVGDGTAPAVVSLSDGVRQVRLTAVEVRRAIDLPSLCFDLKTDGTQVNVTGRGHGHGVGLCQWGAKGLAERGLSYAEILQHYYPGCELRRFD